MKFIDEQHQIFWNEKYKIMQEQGKTDVYYKAIVYTLGICETTRDNFNKIFNLKQGEINIDSINGAFQTGTSVKVTRLAFSLWNRCNYDSEKDLKQGKVSEDYNVSEVFCCSYAPYFVEALKIRYPEYFREYQTQNKTMQDKIKEFIDLEEKKMIKEQIQASKKAKKIKDKSDKSR